MNAARPPGRSTANDCFATSPPTVSNTASTPDTAFVTSGVTSQGTSAKDANVWDDSFRTHVQRLLQALLGLPAPIYRHHRLLLGPDGKIVYPGFPADVLWKFRFYSLIAQMIVWTTIGLVFSALLERMMRKSAASGTTSRASDAGIRPSRCGRRAPGCIR